MTVRARRLLVAVALMAGLAPAAHAVDVPVGAVRIPAMHVEQTGKVPAGVSTDGALVLVNQGDDAAATVTLDFDLSSVTVPISPLARLQLADVARLPIRGVPPSRTRAAMQVWATIPGQDPFLVSSTPAKPPSAMPSAYPIDVTRAVNAALARPVGQRGLRLELRLAGKPNSTAYAISTGGDHPAPAIEIIPPTNWRDDFDDLMTPFTQGPTVYRESCMPFADSRDEEVAVRLLYPAKRIVEVIHNGTGEKLREGRDYVLRDGTLVLPRGSHAPIQINSEFFNPPPKSATAPTRKGPVPYRLEDGTFYHERQIEVTYEPASREWSMPAPLSSLDKLPRFKSLLASKSPVRIVLFGDSISIGGQSTRFQGGWPYQPCFGDLVARAVEERTGSKVTFMNHSQAGATASFAADQAESLVADMKPDLCVIAFGMNDRHTNRRAVYLENMLKAIDLVRRKSPDTEFVVVTPMMNNPRQPEDVKPAPIFFIHDTALKIDRPGLAFVDVTAAHREILRHKNYLDLSGNGVNHPNDFLHRVYAMELCELLLPEKGTRP